MRRPRHKRLGQFVLGYADGKPGAMTWNLTDSCCPSCSHSTSHYFMTSLFIVLSLLFYLTHQWLHVTWTTIKLNPLVRSIGPPWSVPGHYPYGLAPPSTSKRCSRCEELLVFSEWTMLPPCFVSFASKPDHCHIHLANCWSDFKSC